MLKLRWEASGMVRDGELVVEPFEGELRAAIVVGIAPHPGADPPAGGVAMRLEAYGEPNEQARMIAAALHYASQRGYLPATLGHLARMAPGVAAYILTAKVSD
jgi:hypothetical protein